MIDNAVFKKSWFDDLPRAQYSGFKQIQTNDNWFSVYDIGFDIYAIYEGRHFQEVISFLILGKDKALLLDTGMGISDMKALVESLSDLPVIVLNTHAHFDHIGGNHQFAKGYILDTKSTRNRASNGIANSMVCDQMKEGCDFGGYPINFDPYNYTIAPFDNWTFISDGFEFELGERLLKVIATPGHSPDSIMLVDEKNMLLFTGDTVYPATLYAHLKADDGMTSIVPVYCETMKRLAKIYSGFTLICSHNEPMRPGSFLKEIASAFTDIVNQTAIYEIDGDNLRKYAYDGFCIVTQ